MKLLVVTQVVDTEHPSLGFFTRWIDGFSKNFDSVEVICLQEGTHAFLSNVQVHSLGKEEIKNKKTNIGSRIRYAIRFLSLAWKLRREYDAVFVHMNQEYVLIAGLLWKLFGKRVYLWRNHGSGSLATRIAGRLSKKVFAPSSRSYTAQFPNWVQMPVGVDIDRFVAPQATVRSPGSVLMVGRISTKKHVREVVDALASLALRGTHLPLTLVGPTSRADEPYRDGCVSVATAAKVPLSLYGSRTHAELPHIFAEHDIVVNVSEAGMFDKTMLEALASGCLLLTRHEDLIEDLDPLLHTDGTPLDIADRLAALVALHEEDRTRLRVNGQAIALRHSLDALMVRLKEAFNA